jgi:hypothetical protein
VKAAVEIVLVEQQREDFSTDLGRALMQSFKDKLATESLHGDELVMKKVFEYLGSIANLKSASEGRKQATEHLSQVSTILASKVTVVQAKEFRDWLASLARKVAEAVKEEGFMGIGGERISRQESSALSDIEKALRV